MKRLLLVSDVHLMNDPADLTETEIRKQWSPALMLKEWMPMFLVEQVVSKLRNSSLRVARRLKEKAPSLKCDQLITLGDQCHGIAERGLIGRAGRKVAREFLELMEETTKEGTLFHVPSEHPLGYWEGEDYLPHIKWKNGIPRPGWVIHRDIGGQLECEAINNWRELFGPIWGVQEVEGLKLVWLDCCLFRWQERILQESGLIVLRLLRETQIEFLDQTFRESSPGSVLLFTHRPEAVFQHEMFMIFQDRIKAVVFGDYHRKKTAQHKVAAFPKCPFKWWFVPALWGVQFGLGNPSYAILEIDGVETTFHARSL